jgi:Cytochrome C oxidase, cbb3-type, subunit III
MRRASRILSQPPMKTWLAGMNVFRDACAGCHGDPNRISQYGEGFYPRVPQFAIDPPRRPDWQLFWIAKNGVRYSAMSAWEGQWHKQCLTTGCGRWRHFSTASTPRLPRSMPSGTRSRRDRNGFIEGLNRIQASCGKRKGSPTQVVHRVGRLPQRLGLQLPESLDMTRL